MAFDDHQSLSVRTKRKPSSAAACDISSSKRRRRQVPIALPASRTVLERRESTAFNGSTTASPVLGPTSFNSRPVELKAPPKTEKPVHFFSRYADPLVHSPQPRPVDSDVSVVSKGVTFLETPPYRRHWSHDQESKAVQLKSQGGIDGVVDLTVVEHIARLEMVEGDDILQTLMRASTPRIKRRFPSEEALTDSERRDRDALRRRRLKLRSQFSGMTEEQVSDDCRVKHAGVGAWLQSPEIETCLFKPAEHGSGDKEGENKVEGAEDDERTQLIEEEAETDEEPTESKINRVSKVMHMNWRHFFLWLVSSAMLLCAMVVAGPFVKKMMQSPLPYCDSEWIEIEEGSYGLADPADNFDRSKALQPFISTASVATRASEPVCQACPVYGNCLNGSVISCAPPYELQYGLCEENPEAQASLDQLAFSIQTFIVEKASKSACGNVSLWSYLSSENGVGPTSDVTASLMKVWLSDVQIFVTNTLFFGQAVSNLPREYVFNRALDMALRDLKDIVVTEDQSQLVVGGNVVPWSCRAKHQLYAHIKLIVLAVALGTVLVFAYRQFLLYRTERQLVDRFVKEVRFFLLDRTRRPDRSYPANYLRDNLFGKQSFKDRKWLCKSVWPKVAAVVQDDLRIRTRVMRLRGEDMIMWEWASSSSPSYRRAGGNGDRGSRAVAPPPKGSTGDARPVPLRRRKNDSRMSLP